MKTVKILTNTERDKITGVYIRQKHKIIKCLANEYQCSVQIIRKIINQHETRKVIQRISRRK